MGQKVVTYDSHTGNVMAVGFHSDGNWMYSGSEDGTIKIWDLRFFGDILVFMAIELFIYSLILGRRGARLSTRAGRLSTPS